MITNRLVGVKFRTACGASVCVCAGRWCFVFPQIHHFLSCRQRRRRREERKKFPTTPIVVSQMNFTKWLHIGANRMKPFIGRSRISLSPLQRFAQFRSPSALINRYHPENNLASPCFFLIFSRRLHSLLLRTIFVWFTSAYGLGKALTRALTGRTRERRKLKSRRLNNLNSIM